MVLGLFLDHPCFVGWLGMHGTYESNMAMYECDVMLAVGARFDDRVTGDLKKFSPNAKIIHIDIDPASIGKNVPVEIPIVGDASAALEQLHSALENSVNRPDPEVLSEWWTRIEDWRLRKSFAYDASETVIKPQFVIEKLHQVTLGDAFVTSDVGRRKCGLLNIMALINPVAGLIPAAWVRWALDFPPRLAFNLPIRRQR